jgi:hypothetical protein
MVIAGIIAGIWGTGNSARCDESQGKVYGKIFADWYYDASNNDAITKKSEIELTRVYLGYNYKIDERFLVDALLDVQRADPATAATAAYDTSKKTVSLTLTKDDRYFAFLKTAYFAWKNIFPHATLTAGQIGCYAFNVQEAVWGHRYISNTLMDKAGWESSADLGASLKYEPIDMVKVTAGVFNGDGFKASQDAYGNYKPALGVQVNPIKDLTLYGYGDWMLTGKSSDTAQTTVAAFAGYNILNVGKIGVEYEKQMKQKGVKDHDVNGLSVYGLVNFAKVFEVFGRFDLLTSKNSWNEKQDGQFIIGGLQYSPVSKIRMAANYQHSLLKKSGSIASDKIYLNCEFNY